MAAGNLDIIVEQGGTFELSLDVFDDDGLEYDMTEYEFVVMKINNKTDSSTITVNLTVSGHVINVNIPYTITKNFVHDTSNYTEVSVKNVVTKYQYEISITKTDVVKKIVRGNMLVIKGL